MRGLLLPGESERQEMSSHVETFLGQFKRTGIAPAVRREVMNELFFAGRRRQPYRVRFVVMLSFAVTLASIGLLANQLVVVLGAMLLSPLMTPIQAASAALVLGWTKQLIRTLALVAFGAAWTIGLSWVIGVISPERAVLPDTLLAMTNPTLYDLLIALIAGAASAYVIIRRDRSTLPGAAVAVSLVPPLAAAGLTISSGDLDLALAATLLFVTNLVAIILAAAGMLLFMGFTPGKMLDRNRDQIRRAILITTIMAILIAMPLAAHSSQLIEEARDRNQVELAVRDWLNPREDDFDVLAINIDGNTVEIDLIGPHEPAGIVTLTHEISSHLGPDTRVLVRWIQRNEIRMR